SKISNCSFINDEDIEHYLPLKSEFHFTIDRIDSTNSVIELSRKSYLAEVKEIKLGESCQVYFIKAYKGKSYFYSDDLEGYVMSEKRRFIKGEGIEVIPINTSSNEFGLA